MLTVPSCHRRLFSKQYASVWKDGGVIPASGNTTVSLSRLLNSLQQSPLLLQLRWGTCQRGEAVHVNFTSTPVYHRAMTNSRGVLVKLIIFALLVAIAPIATYFLTLNHLWNGESPRYQCNATNLTVRPDSIRGAVCSVCSQHCSLWICLPRIPGRKGRSEGSAGYEDGKEGRIIVCIITPKMYIMATRPCFSGLSSPGTKEQLAFQRKKNQSKSSRKKRAHHRARATGNEQCCERKKIYTNGDSNPGRFLINPM